MFNKKALISACFACALVPSLANAALEVALHEANTSVGLKPTTAKKEWKLETDPAVTDSTVDLSQYTPIAGSLSNTYNPDDFTLNRDTSTGLYSLGYTVQSYDNGLQYVGYGTSGNDSLAGGYGNDAPAPDFLVTSFVVATTIGDILVNSSGDFLEQGEITTQLADFADLGTELGTVYNINFVANTDSGGDDGDPGEDSPDNDDVVTPPAANVDTLIYQINLTENTTGPTFDPGVATAYAGAGDFYETANINDPSETIYLDSSEITSSTTAVPEPLTLASGALLAAAAGSYILVRRRPASAT